VSVARLKREVRENTEAIRRQKINLVYGTRRSVTTNGTLVRANLDELNLSQSSPTTSTVPRWA
jgi:hypothetical protein